jgi:hypothetical protein
MPKGPKGEKRPADVIGNAVRVMRIATGDAEEEYDTSDEGEDQAPPRLVQQAAAAEFQTETLPILEIGMLEGEGEGEWGQ